MSETISAVELRRTPSAATSYLYVGLRSDQPYLPPRRYALAGVDVVVIGRGEPTGHRDAERLTIHLPDARISTTHARLTRLGATWVLEDHGSKNGVFVGGAPVERASLAPGTVFELGRTFFVFDSDTFDAPDGDALEVLPGLATLIPALGEQLARLARTAPSNVPVVVRGESGVGKELVARAVHTASGRSGRLVAVNCGALPRTLLEAELFGHKRGAFSGATEDRVGLVRSADHGTLFLDEIAELPAEGQAALLRVLQEGEVTPVGADVPIAVDTRLVSATHRELDALVRDGRFRDDLLGRLAGATIELPPLRARRPDLALIITTLLRRLGAPSSLKLTPAAARWLYGHAWPRNVREVERALGAALAARKSDELDVGDFAEATPPATSVPIPKLAPDEVVLRDRLRELIERHGGNLTVVARELGKDRTQVRRWMKRFGLRRDTDD